MEDWSEILSGLQRGELEALDRVTRLVTNHLARIGAYAYRDSWDDLVQEVIVSLLRSAPTSEDAPAIVRHIRTTTHHKFVDEVRRRRGRRRADSSDPDQTVGWRRQVSIEHAEDVPDAGAYEGGLDEGLRKALSRLDAEERHAVECRYLLGCSNEEGAERLNVSLATYKRRLSKALTELRERLVPPLGVP